MQFSSSRLAFTALSALAAALSSCGGEPSAAPSPATGGGSGGVASARGGSTNGGSTSGGSSTTGGSSSAAGTNSANAGNVSSAGQASAAGGAGAQSSAASGGTSVFGAGGVSTGGRSGVGGAAAGAAPTGGALNAAGASNAGGHSTGGGGASAMGGGANAGGSVSKGGASSGGAAGANAGTNVKIWIAGDSTVQNCSSACPCGWGSQFKPLFNDKVTVQNSAVGGRSVQTWLYDANVTSTLGPDDECTLSSDTYNARWTAMLASGTGMKAGDYLFIQFGINDGDSTCPRHVGLERFKTLHGVMAQAAKDRGAQPIFLTPVSAIACSGNSAIGTRGAFVTAVKDAGTTYGVPVIDLHQLSVNLYSSLGFCPNDANYGAGVVGAFFCEDHTHFEAAGAVKIAGLVAKALQDQGVPLAAYLE